MLCKASLMWDKESFNTILKADTPTKVKRLGRKVKEFNEELWQKNVCRIARTIMIEKFMQIPELAKILFSTNNSYIAEASSYDKNWGIGLSIHHHNIYYPSKWKGSNILGWALMEARKHIIQSMIHIFGS